MRITKEYKLFNIPNQYISNTFTIVRVMWLQIRDDSTYSSIHEENFHHQTILASWQLAMSNLIWLAWSNKARELFDEDISLVIRTFFYDADINPVTYMKYHSDMLTHAYISLYNF